MTNPGWVVGPEPVFDGPGTAVADTLDAVVAGVSSTSGTANPPSDWEKENMNHLAQQIAPLLILVGNGYSATQKGEIASPLSINIESIQALLPYMLDLDINKKDGISKGVISIKIKPALPSELIRNFLEQKYGPELAQTGIYESCGLSNTEANYHDLRPFFEEIKELEKMDHKYVPLKDNPYLSLLAYPVELRHFFSGAIRDEKKDIGNDIIIDNLVHPLTLVDIINYAKKVGELAKVAMYIKIMNCIKEQ